MYLEQFNATQVNILTSTILLSLPTYYYLRKKKQLSSFFEHNTIVKGLKITAGALVISYVAISFLSSYFSSDWLTRN
jgi:hypothetical protein